MAQTKTKQNIGIMTGGGDCPGLNTAIAALIHYIDPKQFNLIGFKGSWKGLIQNDFQLLLTKDKFGLHHLGGTVLGSAKTFPLRERGALAKMKKTITKHKLDAHIVIGGDSTLFVANQLQKKLGLPMIGIPKTIDNDIPQNDTSIGFMTAVQTVCNSIETVRTSAQSHGRAIVVEVMGRHCGALCAHAALAAQADIALIPERPCYVRDLEKRIKKLYRQRQKQERPAHLIIAAAEGALLLNDKGKPLSFQHKDTNYKGDNAKSKIKYGGIAYFLANFINDTVDWDARALVLGHMQRGGSPVAEDRILACKLAQHAAILLQDQNFDSVVLTHKHSTVHKNLSEVFGDQEPQKNLDDAFIDNYLKPILL